MPKLLMMLFAAASNALAAPTVSVCESEAAFRDSVLDDVPAEDRQAVLNWAPGWVVDNDGRRQILALAARWLEDCGTREVLSLTKALVQFRTVSSKQDPATGAEFAAMAAFVEQWADARDFRFRVVGDNEVWEVTLPGAGGQGTHVSFVTHADIVPVDEGEKDIAALTEQPSGWSTLPFETKLTTVDGVERLYGRGTEDNKGAIAAVLVVFDTFRRFGLTPRGDLRLIMGTAEESDWSGMRTYAKDEPQAVHTVSVDASYPVVIGESGFVSWKLGLAVSEEDGKRHKGRVRVVDMRAGQFLTQVPGSATMTLARRGRFSKLLLAVEEAVALERGARTERFAITTTSDGSQVEVKVTGEAVHSSVAEEGHNALWVLASIAQRLEVAPDGNGALLRLVASHFAGDHYGEQLGLAMEHPFMGKLLVIPTVLRNTEAGASLEINMRRPAGLTADEFRTRMDEALAKLQGEPGAASLTELEEPYVGEPFLTDPDSKMVKLLVDIYRQRTGDQEAAAKSIRGGTYARLFEGGVDFGPSMPGRPYRGHAPDEYIEVGVLRDMTAMLFQAAEALDASADSATLTIEVP